MKLSLNVNESADQGVQYIFKNAEREVLEKIIAHMKKNTNDLTARVANPLVHLGSMLDQVPGKPKDVISKLKRSDELLQAFYSQKNIDETCQTAIEHYMLDELNKALKTSSTNFDSQHEQVLNWLEKMQNFSDGGKVSAHFQKRVEQHK